MNDNKINVSGAHQHFAVWAATKIPLWGWFVCLLFFLSALEFIDGVQGTNCQSKVDLMTSPQTAWNRAGCVINNVREVLPSRSGNNSDTTAP
jgi:hypothetical protein